MASVPDTIVRNGTYYFKKRVPSELAGHPDFGGKPFVQYSLKTGDRPIAVLRASEARLEFDRRCQLARRGKPLSAISRIGSGASRPIVSTEVILYHARRHRDAIVQIDAQNREVAGEEGPHSLSAEYLEFYDEYLGKEDAERVRRLKKRDHSLVRARALRILNREGVEAPQEHPRLADLCNELISAEIDAYKAIQDSHMNEGLLRPEPQSPQLRDAPKAHPTRSGTKLEAVAASYKSLLRASRDWGRKIDAAIRSFEQVNGQLPVEKIRRQHVQDWVHHLLRTPKNQTQRLIAGKASDDPSAKRINGRTVRDGYLAPLRRVLQHAVEEGRIEFNPVQSVSVPTAGTKKAGRRGFTHDELKSLFQHPVFTGCASPLRINEAGHHLLRDYRYWAPLIALFSGARAAEIAQLRRCDVELEGDVPHFRIESYDEDARLKTGAATRSVPIHPELLRLGLGSHIQRTFADPRSTDRLFPEWKRRSGRYSNATGQRNFNERICASISVKTERPVFHSFRHNMKTRLSAAGVSAQFQNAIMGHEQSGMDGTYLHPEVDMLVDAMRKLEHPGLSLSHLYPENRGVSKS